MKLKKPNNHPSLPNEKSHQMTLYRSYPRLVSVNLSLFSLKLFYFSLQHSLGERVQPFSKLYLAQKTNALMSMTAKAEVTRLEL